MSHIRTSLAEATFPAPIDNLRRPWAMAPGAHWYEALTNWLHRLRERDEMRALTERERRDAGITAYDIAIESRKLPWRD